MKARAILVLTTVKTRPQARLLARRVLDARVAACASILPSAESHYNWQGKREKATECLILFKLPPASYPALYRLLVQHHPYECPEILALPALQGHFPYLQWLKNSTQPQTSTHRSR